MRLKIRLPKDKKSAKIITIILAIVVAGYVVVTAFLGLSALNQKNNWQRLNAVVADYDTRNGENVWTEFEYEYNNEAYTYRQKGHSYWMKRGAEIEIYCNPDNPEDMVVAKNMFALFRTLLIITGINAGFFAIYLLNFFVVKNKQDRLQKQLKNNSDRNYTGLYLER